VADAAAKEAHGQERLAAGKGEKRLAGAEREQDVDCAARGVPREIAVLRASRLEAV